MDGERSSVSLRIWRPCCLPDLVGLALWAFRRWCSPGGWPGTEGRVHAIPEPHQVHGGVGGEGIELDPRIHIAGRRGLVAGGGADLADAFQLTALLPCTLPLRQQGQHLVRAESGQGG